MDQPKPTPLMLGVDLLEEQRCVIDYGKDLIQFPMQSDCLVALVCVESWLVLRAIVRSALGAFTSQAQWQIAPTRNDCLAFPDGNVHPPDNVNVSENDESIDEPVSENHLCLEENFSALMQGNNSDGRVCLLEVCAAHDSPLTNTVRRRLHDISSAERWTSRDHDLSKTSRRKSALTNLELLRPRPCGVLSSLFWFQCAHLTWTTKRSREIHCLFVQLVGSKTMVLWRCACCCGMCI